MRAAALVAVGFSLIASVRSQNAPETARKLIEIRPQELRVALPALGKIEDVQVVFLSEDVANRHTEGASGTLSCAEAIEQLLHGTGLTYRFLEGKAVMILPASTGAGIAPAGPRSEDNEGNGVVASSGPVTRLAQVVVTAPSDAQQLNYFRLLAAASRTEYKRLVDTLPFANGGTMKFPTDEGPWTGFPAKLHAQSGSVAGVVLSRVLKLTAFEADLAIQVHNTNAFPVFVEVDFGRTHLGDGAYAALAPGQTLKWSWPAAQCDLELGGPGLPLTSSPCTDYNVPEWSARLRVLKKWEPSTTPAVAPAHDS